MLSCVGPDLFDEGAVSEEQPQTPERARNTYNNGSPTSVCVDLSEFENTRKDFLYNKRQPPDSDCGLELEKAFASMEMDLDALEAALAQDRQQMAVLLEEDGAERQAQGTIPKKNVRRRRKIISPKKKKKKGRMSSPKAQNKRQPAQNQEQIRDQEQEQEQLVIVQPMAATKTYCLYRMHLLAYLVNTVKSQICML